MFVVEDGRLVGSVSREDLDKAIGHGLAHAPVKGIMSGSAVSCAEDTPLAELRQLVLDAEDGRVAVLDGDAPRRRRHPQRPPARARGAGRARTGGGTLARRRAALARAAHAGHRGDRVARRAAGGRVSRRRLRARHPARRAGLRHRHRDRGRRDRLRPPARGGARRAHPDAREVRHRHDRLWRRRARRPRHGPDGVLRRAGGAADGRARDHPRGSLPARLHPERDGGLAGAGGPRTARRSVRRPPRPRAADAARAPQPLLHRRSDADLPRDPVREPVRAASRRTLRAARARLRRDGARAGSLVVAAPGRAGGAARGGQRSRRDPAPRRSSAPTARSTRISPPTRRERRCTSGSPRCATSSASTFRPGGSGSPCSRAG